MTIALGIIVGFLVGVSFLGGLAYVLGKKEAKRKAVEKKAYDAKQAEFDAQLAKLVADLKKIPVAAEPSLQESVQKRLKLAMELTSRQTKIDVTLPREEQTYQANNLELEKLNILNTILKDGFDPVITLRYDTGDKQMTLSTYVEQIRKALH